MSETVSILTNLPANDGNFQCALNRASTREIKESIAIMQRDTKGMHKTRINACNKELRTREKINNKKERKE
jgi:hypothetical protein